MFSANKDCGPGAAFLLQPGNPGLAEQLLQGDKPGVVVFWLMVSGCFF